VQDLQSQKLSRDEIYNIWHNRMAGKAWKSNFLPLEDPMVYVEEQWAAYSQYLYYHKIVGDVSHELFSTLGFLDLQQKITQKFALTRKTLKSNLLALDRYMLTLQKHKRATLSKLIHNWSPTYSVLSRQGRESSPLCLCCQNAIETGCHVLHCSSPSAVLFRSETIQMFLKQLLHLNKPLYILVVFEYKLSLTLIMYPIRNIIEMTLSSHRTYIGS